MKTATAFNLILSPNTLGTGEVVLRDGPPSVDGESKVNQIYPENHQLIVKRLGAPPLEIIKFISLKGGPPSSNHSKR